ncbi:hypothetical protein DM02DRAFT_533289 [Periconia macrospinosa]|uniref:Rhodopsin domain-containing protein n=1 Tax=Periconia macrospinosa TaxID=97972 RepID=A0A2V1DJG4_9PLEO|nr:hypothetical protein DM02DRAFT_533289 [Periconia macrospinosa]
MAQPHLVNDSIAIDDLAIAMTFLGLSLIVFAIRIYTRVYPKYKLDASDYTISVAVPFIILAHSFYAAAVSQGLGRHTVFVPPANMKNILLYMFIIPLAWGFATAFARISVACMLLPLAISRAWKLALKAVIGVQILTIVMNLIFKFATCRPLRASWETVPDRKCWSDEVGLRNGISLICKCLCRSPSQKERY